MGLLFLEETNDRAKHRRDVGLEAGRWLTSKLSPSQDTKSPRNLPGRRNDECAALAWEEDYKTKAYGTSQHAAHEASASASEVPQVAASEINPAPSHLSVERAFNRQVVLNIVCYGIVA